MTADEYFNDHLPHRVNLLTTFRERYSTTPSRPGFRSGEPRDLFRCAKDISMLMVRFFCDEMGLHLPKPGRGAKGGVDLECIKGWSPVVRSVAPSVSILQFTEAEATQDPRRYQALLAVMKAANRAVAHIGDVDVDHPIRTESDHWMLTDSISWIESLVESHIYVPNGRSLKAAMSLPNNVM